MLDDQQLLRQYASDGSETAFRELVARHVNLVYSTALRQTGGDDQLAKDAAQIVFADLARKAGSLAGKVILAGWLHRATRFAALQLVRTERRRRQREQQAVIMNAIESEAVPDWDQIRPLIDEALDRLSREDRDALLLRFFEQRSFAEVGAALGSNEDTARKRVSRALEKLRTFLSRRGASTTTEAFSLALSSNAVHAAPAAWAGTLAVASLASAANSAAASLTLLKLITITKTQAQILGAAAIAAALAVGGIALVASRQHPTQNAAALQIAPGDFGFVASGTLEIRTFMPDGSEMPANPLRRSYFKIEQLNGKWALETMMNGIKFIGGTDGASTFEIHDDPNSKYKDGNSRMLAAIVDPGNYPLSASPWENMVLFAFTPLIATNDLPAPWSMARNDPQAYLYSLACNALLDSGLPDQIKFVCSSSKVKTALDDKRLDKTGNQVVTKLFARGLSRYHEGFVGGDYAVVEKTNFGGRSVPLKFVMREFNPEYPPSAVFVACAGTVTNVAAPSDASLIPKVPANAVLSVADYRFADVAGRFSHISYRATNEWPASDDLRLVQAFEEAKLRASRKPMPADPVREPNIRSIRAWPLIVLLISIFLAFPVYFFFLRTNPNSSKM